jgi:hypothetical protein
MSGLGAQVGYTSAEHAFSDWVRCARLWVERYLALHGARTATSAGEPSDTFVAAREATMLLRGTPPEPLAGLRDHRTVEAELSRWRANIERRLDATDDRAAAPLAELTDAFALSGAAADLLVAVAVFQASVDDARLYRYAWADFTVTRPTVGFLLDLVAADPASRQAAARELGPHAPLRRFGLLELHAEPGAIGPTPLLLQRVRAPDGVVAQLSGLGSHLALPRDGVRVREPVEPFVVLDCQAETMAQLRAALRRAHARSGPAVIAVTGRPGSGRTAVAVQLVSPRPVVEIELKSLTRDPQGLLHALRDALQLRALAVLRFDGLDLSPQDDSALFDQISAQLRSLPSPVLLVLPDRATLRMLELDTAEVSVGLPTSEDVAAMWQATVGSDPIPEWAQATVAGFRLGAGHVLSAFREAIARAPKKVPTPEGLARAVRRRLPRQVAKLAELVETRHAWGDLVLPAESRQELEYLVACARHRQLVYDEWDLGSRIAYGRAISALFYGPPGTGKTLAASVVASALGRELFRVDLSRVVDKYIGETEKNLGKLFDSAESAQAVLFFDEADSLFAKRTEVKSSNDRYANLGVNYLLQRMEAYEGVTILTTNFDESLDDALARRIAVRIRFPMPTPEMRAELWRRLLPPKAPLGPGIDFARLADYFELAGGHIKSAVVRASFLAAEAGSPITYEGLWRAAAVTYRDLGKLVTDDDFVPPAPRKPPGQR